METQFLLVGKLFVLMGIGVLLRKRGMIPEEGKKLLTDLIINLILPCSIIISFLTEVTSERIRQTTVILVLSAGIQLASYFVGYFGYRHCKETHQPVMQYGTLCSNSGICGISDSPAGGHVDARSLIFYERERKIPPKTNFNASMYCSGANWYRFDAVKIAIAGFGNRKPESHWRMQHSTIHDFSGKHCGGYEYGPITPPGYAVFFSCSAGTAAAGCFSDM